MLYCSHLSSLDRLSSHIGLHICGLCSKNPWTFDWCQVRITCKLIRKLLQRILFRQQAVFLSVIYPLPSLSLTSEGSVSSTRMFGPVVSGPKAQMDLAASRSQSYFVWKNSPNFFLQRGNRTATGWTESVGGRIKKIGWSRVWGLMEEEEYRAKV